MSVLHNCNFPGEYIDTLQALDELHFSLKQSMLKRELLTKAID